MTHTKNHKPTPSLNAWLLHLADGFMDRIYGIRKRRIYRELPSTVVEIGPGAGANFRYYRRGTHVIAVEPNVSMHPRLRAAARRKGLDLEIKSAKGEKIDLPDKSVLAVVGTLVLCTVDDPSQVVSEVLRILKPSGRYLFLEHVAALPRTRLRSIQELLFNLWLRLTDGCHLNRESHRIIAAAGFKDVEMDCFTLRSQWLPFAPHIFGVAVK
jgi:SAM-dependent methyltransferase